MSAAPRGGRSRTWWRGGATDRRAHRSSLFGVSFRGCGLTGTASTTAEPSPVAVEGGSWAFVSLGAPVRGSRSSGAGFREADLAHLGAEGVVLTDVDLTGADLTGADLTGADLTGARPGGADLRRSLFGDLDPRVVDVRATDIDVAQALHLVGTLGLDVH